MKPIPLKTDPAGGMLCLYAHIVHDSIDKHAAERGNHAIKAKDAYERAVIFLRLLAGEREWTDGYERKIDDCFEMNDGDAVCSWLLEFSDADPRIKHLIFHHSACGKSFESWEKYRNAHRVGELALPA